MYTVSLSTIKGFTSCSGITVLFLDLLQKEGLFSQQIRGLWIHFSQQGIYSFRDNVVNWNLSFQADYQFHCYFVWMKQFTKTNTWVFAFSADSMRLWIIAHLSKSSQENILNRLFKGLDLLYVLCEKEFVVTPDKVHLNGLSSTTYRLHKDPEETVPTKLLQNR